MPEKDIEIDVKQLLKTYKDVIDASLKRKKEYEHLDFNFFTIVSELYYRENLHSQIIKALFRIPSFFEAFFLELSAKTNKEIHFDFNATSVETEAYNRIDITIIDETKKQAIFIENKINDATDQDKQIERYYKKLKDEKFEVVAILYLTKGGFNLPHITEEKETIEKLLLPIAAIENEKSVSLYTIINKSIETIDNIHHFAFSKQYLNLINNLAMQEAEINQLEDFEKEITKTPNAFSNLLALKESLNRLPQYLALELKRIFSKKPKNEFWKVTYDKNQIAFFDFEINKKKYAINVLCEMGSYEVSIFKRGDSDNKKITELVRTVQLEHFNPKTTFTDSPRLYVNFLYPAKKQELIEFIEDCLKKLEDYAKKLQVVE